MLSIFDGICSASKSRLLDLSFRSNISRSQIKPNELIPPLYYLVLFNEMAEQNGNDTIAGSTAMRTSSSAAPITSNRPRGFTNDTRDSESDSDRSLLTSTDSKASAYSFQNFRSLIAMPVSRKQHFAKSGTKSNTADDDFESGVRSHSTG